MSATDARQTLVLESVPDADGPVRDWWVVIGMTIAAVSAAVASFTGLYGLATVAGWPVRLAWLLPITIDAHAMTSARVWLASTTRSATARRFARTNALGAIAMSIAGNAAYHAIGAGLIDLSWPIVVLVGAVPAAVLGLTAHLHALRSRVDAPPHPENGPKDVGEDVPSAPPKRRVRRPPRRTDEELMDAARFADAQYRQMHGRPITRDALRTSLRISTPKATELRRQLNDPDTSDDTDAP